MKNTNLELRGHHVEYVAEEYIRRIQGKIHKTKPQKAVYNSDPLDKYKHTLDNILTPSNNYEMIEELIIEQKQKIGKETVDQIVMNLDLMITIVFGGDSICKRCQTEIPEQQCKQESSTINDKQDQKALDAYGLEKGKPYTSKEIIEKILKYHEKTGFPSPRAGEKASRIHGGYI